jgi:membrane protease YdiL (CAAX protease family)
LDYYFCPSCSKPWRPQDANLGPAPEPEWDDETRVRLKAPEVYQLFFIYLAAIVCAAVAAHALQPSERLGFAGYILTSIAVLAVTLWSGMKYRGVLGPILRRPGIFHKMFVPGLLLGALLIGVNLVYHGWMQKMMGQDFATEDIHKTLSFPTAVLLVCVVPAITEEIGFRGLMQTILLRALTPRKALFLSSTLFAAAHFSILSLPYLFLVGYLLGWLLHRTGSLYPGMIVHAAHNFVVIWIHYN